MMIKSWSCRVLGIFVFLASTAISAVAMQNPVDSKSLLPLRAPLKAGAHVKVQRFPLDQGRVADLDLEAFEVLAPDAVVAIYGEGGK